MRGGRQLWLQRRCLRSIPARAKRQQGCRGCTCPDKILTQLFRFSLNMLFLLLLLIYMFAQILSRSESKHSSETQASAWYSGWLMLQMLLNQAKALPVSVAGRLLVVVTAIGVLFWLQVWQSQLKTEMVAYDTSRVVRSLADALRSHKTAAMTRTEASSTVIERLAQDQPQSVIGRLYKEAVFNRHPTSDRNAMARLLASMTPSSVAKHIIIVSKRLLSYLQASVCGFLNSAKHEYDFLVGSEVLVDIFTGPWFSHYLSDWYRSVLRKKLLRIRESGLGIHFAYWTDQETKRLAATVYAGQDVECTHSSLDSFLKEWTPHREREPVELDSLADVFILLSTAFLISAAVLVIEGVHRKTVKNFRSRRLPPGSSLFLPSNQSRRQETERRVRLHGLHVHHFNRLLRAY